MINSPYAVLVVSTDALLFSALFFCAIRINSITAENICRIFNPMTETSINVCPISRPGERMECKAKRGKQQTGLHADDAFQPGICQQGNQRNENDHRDQQNGERNVIQQLTLQGELCPFVVAGSKVCPIFSWTLPVSVNCKISIYMVMSQGRLLDDCNFLS